jgi:uncharacterized membrane protein
MVRQSTLAAAGVVAAMGALSALAYPQMPERMVTHWNAAGEPDDSMGRTLGLVALPAVTAATVAVLQVLPTVDPGEGIQQFRGAYDAFVVLLAVFLGYVHVLVVAVNAGYSVSVSTAILPGVGILLYGAGAVLDRAEQNWFLGIRTPWSPRKSGTAPTASAHACSGPPAW